MAFSAGLTDEKDVEIKESLLAMQVRFLKHGKKWHIFRFRKGDVEHILLSTLPIKDVKCDYQTHSRSEDHQKWVDDHRVQSARERKEVEG